MRKTLLVCGILAGAVYIAADVVAAMRFEGYSYVSQAVSELSAVGAPTRRFLIEAGVVYCALLLAFGIGVWQSAGRERALRVAGSLIVVHAVIGYIGGLLFPMNPREAERSLTDTMHLVYVGVIVLLMIVYIAFAAAARGKAFRVYSLATIVAMLLAGSAAGMQAPRLAAHLPTPWLGLIERVSVYAPVVWAAVLAIALVRASAVGSRLQNN